jgi:fructose-bisphosphate aldolase, class I
MKKPLEGAAGTGLISGRKTFQKPTQNGIAMFHAIQDLYLDKELTVV